MRKRVIEEEGREEVSYRDALESKSISLLCHDCQKSIPTLSHPFTFNFHFRAKNLISPLILLLSFNPKYS